MKPLNEKSQEKQGFPTTLAQLNERSRSILRVIVEAYVETGAPIGSRTLSRRLGLELSPATIRNVMADLEEMGLLFAPHTSAGRLPTDAGLRLFVDGLLEIGGLTEDERKNIDVQCAAAGINPAQVLEQATDALSGLTQHAGLVAVPKQESPLTHIEFVNLSPGSALAVLVYENGVIENRLVEVPIGVPASALVEASNYLSSRLAGRSLQEARDGMIEEIESQRAQLDSISSDLVARGLERMPHEHGGATLDGAVIQQFPASYYAAADRLAKAAAA